MTAQSAPPPRSVLVYVGLDRIGDGLLKLPFVRGLREAFPDARITWLAGKDTSVYADLLAPFVAGLLDEVIERGNVGLRPAELLRRPLQGRAFDLVIDTQRVALATCVLWRVRHKAFVSPFANFLLSSRKPPPGYEFPRAMQRQMLDLLEIASGRPFPTPARLDLELPADAADAARRLLPEGGTYVGIAPGSGGRPKCWPLENFITLANVQFDLGRTPVFLLGPQELEWEAEIRASVPGALLPLQDENAQARFGFSPVLTIALAGRLAAAIANDSGAGHMLAIGGAPLVSLFGRTVPEKFTPMGDRLVIVRAQDFGGREMHFIPLQAALDALEAALTGRPYSAGSGSGSAAGSGG